MAHHRDPTPAENYSVLSGEARVCKGSRRLKSIPAEDYRVLSGNTSIKQDKKATKSYNALLATGAKFNKQQVHVENPTTTARRGSNSNRKLQVNTISQRRDNQSMSTVN